MLYYHIYILHYKFFDYESIQRQVKAKGFYVLLNKEANKPLLHSPFGHEQNVEKWFQQQDMNMLAL